MVKTIKKKMAENSGDLSVLSVIEALGILFTPGETKKGQKTEPTKDITDFIQQNLSLLDARLSCDQFQSLGTALKEAQKKLNCHVPSDSAEWQFVCKILELLHVLAHLLKEKETDSWEDITHVKTNQKHQEVMPPMKQSAFSVKHSSIVKLALEFVACLGISPNLSPGVGIRVPHYAKMMTQMPVDAAALSGAKETCERWKRTKLNVCISTYVKFLNFPELKSVFTGFYLNTVLAALLQLMYAYPKQDENPKVSEDSNSKHYAAGVDSGDNSVSSEQCSVENEMCKSSPTSYLTNTESMAVDIEDSGQETGLILNTRRDVSTSATKDQPYTVILNNLWSNISHELLIRELLVLQTGVPKHIQNTKIPGYTASPPDWLRKACALHLAQLVRAPEGIVHLYTAVTAGSVTPSNWKQCGVVARIIAKSPIPEEKKDHYVINVSQQLFHLLNAKGKDTTHLTHLLGTVATAMSDIYKEAFYHHFHQPLLNPLHWCLKERAENVEGALVVSEVDLSECVENVHKVYVSGQQPQSNIVCHLKTVVPALWALFCITRTTVYSIKRYVKDIVVSYLKFLSRVEAAACLRHLCTSQAVDGDCSWMLTVRFEAGVGGGLQAACAVGERVTKLSDTQQVEAVLDILHDLKKDGIAGELLVTLLKELTDVISKETEQPDIILPVNMERLEVREERSKELVKRVTLLHLLASICEAFGSECLTDNTQILLFVKASLERGVAVCRGTSEAEMAIFETETMSMAMGLLTAVMAGGIKMEDKDLTLLDEMLPLLEVIGEGHADEFIQEMASDIRIAIATRGAVWSSLQESRNREKKNSKAEYHKSPLQELKIQTSKVEPTSRPLIQVLSDQPSPASSDTLPAEESDSAQLSFHSNHVHSVPLGAESNFISHSNHSEESCHDDVSASARSSTEQYNMLSAESVPASVQLRTVTDVADTFSEQPEKDSLQTVFEELCDPLLPVRGHALIALARLIEERDSEALSKKEVVQKVFEENLRHGDSYLYLAAIRGLSALSNNFPESVVPFLAAEFAGFSKATAASVTVEQKLKVGEALMKVTRNLGETIPKYREVLLGAVLTGARDTDATVRASSISNLAELCSLLRFSLGPVLQEVLNCCSNLLESDEVIVRQAASLMLAKLLEGLDMDALTVLENVMKDLYHLLKKVHSTDADDAVRLHANMALAQLDAITRKFLFPQQTLQKKIQVLSDKDTFR